MFDLSVNLANHCFDKDRNEVVNRAFSSGVNGFLITSVNLDESVKSQQLANNYNNCWSTAGIHPHNSKMWTKTSLEVLYNLAKKKRVVAIGECGLDFDRNLSDKNIQEKAFVAQLSLAVELEFPVFLHCRRAHERFLTLLDPWLNKLPSAVLHCFTGTHQEAVEYLKRGLYLGITGWICDERRGLGLRNMLSLIPVENILLETNSPYLLPRDMTIKVSSNRNEPAYLAHILQKVAFWRKEPIKELEIQIDKNVNNLLNIKF